MAGEVAAVNRGKIFRSERAQVTRVIPVVEMTMETFETVHRAERRFEPFDRRYHAEPAKIVRCDSREQIQTDVGRGRPVRNNRSRLFLEIIRR